MRLNITYLACAFIACAVQMACTSRSSDSDAIVVLRSLDGASASDTIVAKAKLPTMQQQQEALYHVNCLDVEKETPSIYLSDMFDKKYRIIPLETSEECIVGEVNDIQMDDSMLFVVDTWSASISVFDLNGKFVRHIGRKGHAKDEYVTMLRMSLDRGGKRVCVLDEDSQKLVFYDYKGNFLGKESRYFWYEQIAFLADGKRVLLTLPYEHQDYPGLDSYRLTVADEKGIPLWGVLTDMGFPKYMLDKRQFSCGANNALHSNPDGVYYIDILSPDTIWKVDEKKCAPFLVADFGEPFTTPVSYREMTDKKYYNRINQVDFLRDDFIFTKNFGYVNFDSHAIINLKTGRYVRGNLTRKPGETLHNFFEFAYESYPNERIFLYDWNQNQIVKVCSSYELYRRLGTQRDDKEGKKIYQSWPQSDRDILDRITPEDNPVLVVATFKDF